MGTVSTGASSAEKGSFSGGVSGEKRQKKSSSSEDTREQKKVLKKAAQEATPFCEECQKKKEEEQSAIAGEETKKEEQQAEEEKEDEEKEPQILNVYWIDEQGGMRNLSELLSGQIVTMRIDVEDGMEGKTLDVTIKAPEGKTFKGGEKQQNYTNLLIECDNTVYIDDFCLEYENK